MCVYSGIAMRAACHSPTITCPQASSGPRCARPLRVSSFFVLLVHRAPSQHAIGGNQNAYNGMLPKSFVAALVDVIFCLTQLLRWILFPAFACSRRVCSIMLSCVLNNARKCCIHYVCTLILPFLQRWLPLASSCLHTSNSLRKQFRPLLCVAGA